MIHAQFESGRTYIERYGLTQWDFGQQLLISGLDLERKNVEIHFAEECSDVALRELGTVENGVISVDIPDVLLQTGSNIMAYVFLSTENEGETIATVRLRVKQRQKPEDYETPEAQNVLQKILAIAQSVREDADNGKFDGKPGADGYSPSILLTETAEGVQITVQNKDSESTVLVKNGKDGLPGESAYKIAVRLGFKGTEQEWMESLKGEQGEPGAAPHIGENGNWYIGEEDTGKPSRGGRGDPGEKGDPGKSAYEYAVDGGYEGTEEEFTEKLSEDYAPAIIESASGESILVEDSANRQLQGLHLYGKSTQVTTTGAQLFDYKKAESGKWLNTETGETEGTIGYWTSDFIPVEPGRYCFEGDKGSGRNWVYDKDKHPIKYISLSNGSLLINNGEHYLRMTASDNDAPKELFMLNKGEVPLPYEPYTGGKPSPSPDYPQKIVSVGDKEVLEVTLSNENGTEMQKLTFFTPNGLPGIPVASGGNYVDETGKKWICDEIDLERGEYVQRVKKETFVGDDKYRWELQSINDYGIANYQLKLYDARTDRVSKYLIDRFQQQFGLIKDTKDEGAYMNQSPYIFIRVNKERADTLAKFKEWLSQNPITVIYELAEPIIHDLDPATIEAYKQLRTNYPVTTVINDAGAGMKLSYVADTKLYIDKLFAENQKSITNTNKQLLERM